MYQEIGELNNKMKDVNKDRGFHWSSLSRMATTTEFNTMKTAIQGVMSRWSLAVHDKHAKKWYHLSGFNYIVPYSDYDIDMQSIFPREFANDAYTSVKPRFNNCNNSPTLAKNSKFTNTTNNNLPDSFINLVNKGANFCVPPVFDKTFWFTLNLRINRGFFGYRWSQHRGTCSRRPWAHGANPIALP